MILELDCGNTFIKWRMIAADNETIESGQAETDDALLEQLITCAGTQVDHCRLVSVRSGQEAFLLAERLNRVFSVQTQIAAPSRELAGVVNGYVDYRRLGLDRWLALVAAYHLVQNNCVVIDLGTAVTADWVDAQGQHLGGFICPGMLLMRNQLKAHTRRIRYDDEAMLAAVKGLQPGRSTAEAVERGCMSMLRSFVQDQWDMASEHFQSDCEVFLTGGDVSLVAKELPKARIVPDLVFRGLSLACPMK